MAEPQIVKGSDGRYRVWDGTMMVGVYEPEDAAGAQSHLDAIIERRPKRTAAPAPVPQVIELSAPAPVSRRAKSHNAAAEDPDTPHIKRFTDGWRVWNPSPKVRAYVGDGTRGPFASLAAASGRMREIIMELAEDGHATKKVARKAEKLAAEGGDLFGGAPPKPRVIGSQASMFSEGTMLPPARPATASRAAPGQGAFKFNGGRYYVTRGEGGGSPFVVIDPEGYPAGGAPTRDLAQEIADEENRILEARRARARSSHQYSMNGAGNPTPAMMNLLARVRGHELERGGRGMDVGGASGASVAGLLSRGLITTRDLGEQRHEVWRGRPGHHHVTVKRSRLIVANTTAAGRSALAARRAA